MAEARSYRDSDAYRRSQRKTPDDVPVWPLSFPSTFAREVRRG